MKLIDIIEVFIAGDWGEETYSKEGYSVNVSKK